MFIDTSLRITNLNPFFTLHVDSSLQYQLQINKNPENYFWYLKNAPVGLRIGKDNGLISFRAEKAYFLSGRLKYDVTYKVALGVQNLYDPADKKDTSFNIVFFNTEIIPSQVKPTVSGTIWIEEAETISFKVLCETGSFPIENILMTSSIPITNYKVVQKCGDDFFWTPGYDFTRDSDSGKVKPVVISFIGSTKMGVKDTTQVKIIVRDALNQNLAREEFNQVVKNLDRYVLQLKYTFLQLDKKLKKTKNTRVAFDLTSASTSLTGTILSTSGSASDQRTGKILPSVGLALVPIKEASSPNKPIDQNQASVIRSSIKRLEYMRQDNQLLGEKDPDIVRKINKLKDELKQVQMQLIDVPLEFTNDMSAEELNRYFNSPKVNKKYRLNS
ncbi:MAG: hypothetical protein M3Q06_14320 [Bacteroidota bacterium]|nr:hypothetical protein [Bacteroidota bacterium]